MEQTLLTTASYIGLCFSMAALWRLPYAFAPLFTLAFLALGGFVAAFFGQLPLFFHTSVLLGLAALLPALFFFFRRHNSPENLWISLCHAGGQCFIAWYYFGAKFRYFDEFYWAALYQDLFQTGALLAASSPIMETAIPKIHPPLMGIFQYFFSTIPWGESVYQEGSAGMAGFAVLLALFTCVAHICRKYMPLLPAVLVATLVLTMSRIFGTNVSQGVYTIGYAEYYQGALFALGTSLVCFLPPSTLQRVAILATLLLLTLSKATSFLFGLGIIALYGILTVYQDHLGKQVIQNTECAPVPKPRKHLHTLAWCLMMFLTVGAMHFPWVYHIKKEQQNFAHAQQVPSTTLTAPIVSGSIANAKNTTQKEKITLGNMTHGASILKSSKDIPSEVLAIWGRALWVSPLLLSSWLSESTMSIAFTLFPLYASFIVAILCTSFFLRTTVKKEHWLALAMLSTGFLAWFFLRIFIAIHAHSPEEVYRAASFARYMGAYFVAILAHMALMYFTSLSTAYTKYKSVFYITLLVPLGVLLVVIQFSPWQPPRHIALPEKRLAMEKVAQYVDTHTPKGARIWFLSQTVDKEAFWAFRYLVLDQRRTDLRLPWTIAPNKDGFVGLDELLPEAHKKRVDYILLWNEKTPITYSLQGKTYQSADFPLLIPLAR